MPPRGREVSEQSEDLVRSLVALGVPQAKVSDVIHAACRHIEILEDVDHQNLTSRTRKALAKQACNVMDSEKLGPFTLKFLHPNKMLFCVLEANSDLRQNFERCLQKYPPPWHVVWGADECFSGNALHESGRKVLALSFSFLELGRLLISKANYWFTCSVIRAKKANQIPGGHSCIARILFRRQLLDPSNGLHGPGLALPQINVALRASFHALMCDGDGWKRILEASGANGLKPCPRCLNLWSRGSDMAARHRHGPPHVELDCAERAKFVRHTPASLKRTVAELQNAAEDVKRRRLRKSDLENLCKYHGFSPTAEGLWSDTELVDLLRIPDCVVLDWPHNLLQEGVFGPEFCAYCESLGEGKIAEFLDFISEWFPASTSETNAFRQLKNVVEHGGAVNGHSRPSSLEFLIMTAVVRCFLHVSEDVTPHGISLRRLCDLCASIQRCKWATSNVQECKRNIAQCWEAWYSWHLGVHGDKLAKPKSHWLSHTGDFEGLMLDSFVIERLHRRVKQVSRPIVNTANFEETVVQRLLNLHMRAKPDAGASLHGVDRDGVAHAVLSDGLLFRRGSFVAHADLVGQVLFCRLHDEQGVLTVRLCRTPSPRELARKATEWCQIVTLHASHVAEWNVSTCRRAVGYKKFGDNYLVLPEP